MEMVEHIMPRQRKKRLTQKVVKPTFWGQPLFLFFTIWLFIPFLKQEFLLISEFYPVFSLLDRLWPPTFSNCEQHK